MKGFVQVLLCMGLMLNSLSCSSSSMIKENVKPPHNIKVIAHRGASAYAPENTLAAIDKALELGTDAIEIDFRQTKDCALVAFHDASVNRTTNGRGDIADLTFAQVRQLDAGSWFGQAFKGEQIPTIDEVVNRVGKRASLILELKEAIDDCPSPVEKAVEAARTGGIEATVYIKSFYYPLLTQARQLAPQMKQIYVYLYYSEMLNWLIDYRPRFRDPLETGAEVLQEHRFSLSADSVRAIQKAGKQVVVWDVQNEQAMIEAIDIGVDFIETDYPDVAMKLINELSQ